MPSAPANPHIETAKPATKFLVWLGDDSGGTPAAEDETDAIKLLDVTRSAGGRSLDYARFAYDIGKTGEHLQDMQTPDSWNRQIEVRVPDEDDEPIGQAAFWGALSMQSIGISSREEAAMLMARIEPYHFGNVCVGSKVHDPLADLTTEIPDDLVFNPQIDGIIEGNKSSKTEQTDAGADWNLWIDPESMRRTPAETLQAATRSQWTLSEAVRALCGLLNPAETYILNPTEDDLRVAIDNASPPAISNVRLKRGSYLPAYLDALLEPYGFGWFLKLGFDSNDLMTRTITVFERGAGEEREIYLQAPGETLDLAKSNVQEFGLETSISDLANVVNGNGSKQEREVTIELFRGWSEDDDNYSADDLDRTYPGSDFESHPNAWRLWVGNEAGDYTGTRDDVAAIDGPLDLSDIFDTWVPRRRKLDDCLTYDAEFKRLPPFIEWFDPEETDEALQWKPLEPGSVSILNDQIGIYFTGPTPPSYIVAAGQDAKIRITGTVQGDSRIYSRKTRRTSSPNGSDVELFLDLSDRFHDRAVQQTGDYASVLNASSYGADERDDATALGEFVEKVRDTEDAALMNASINLHGIHWDYEIGQVITKVDGRNISFNRFSQRSQEKRYLQITGIQYERQNQRTILRVEGLTNESFLAVPTGGP